MKSIDRVEGTIKLYKDCEDKINQINNKESREPVDYEMLFNVTSIQFSTISCLYVLFHNEIYKKFGYIDLQDLHPTNQTSEYSFSTDILPFIEKCLLEEQLGYSLSVDSAIKSMKKSKI